MIRTPPKRNASRSPDNSRPYKRATTSSPEEGEVDDDKPMPLASLPSRPASPMTPPAKFETKVKFPFKKKNGVEHRAPLPSGSKPESKGKATAVIYERSEEDERRIRDKEPHWKQRPSNLEVSRRKPLADHWEPSLNNARDKERSRLPGWHHDHDERDHRNKRGKLPFDRYSYPAISYSRPSPEMTYNSRPSPSPSRSPPSSSSTHRGKHRLPSQHECSYNFTPPRRDYGVDRIRDKQREKDDAWDRDRDSRYPDDDYSRRGDRQYSNRDWERGREREPDRAYNMDNHDRYWRPTTSPQQDYHRRNRDEYDYHRSPYDGDRKRDMDRYRPPDSPGPSTYTTSSAYPPRSFSPAHTSDRPRTPPPPSSPPPPPPPEPKDETLPYDHPTVSISLPTRRPGAPLDLHSPAPLPLPPAAESAIKQDRERKDAEDSRSEVNGIPVEGKVGMVKKREPVRRTRKEEYEAYGRSFEGCGMQSDYDVTTKLGEGTFGEVHKAIHKPTRRVVALKRILMHNEKEGMPVTALREIKILKALKHPCIVNILDMFVVRSNGEGSSLSVYMVFPYMDHDLAGLLENERVKLQPSHIKLYMKQLLEGTEYMHRNHILHRDMKAANLLISNDGSLRIADFGLARAFDPDVGLDRGKERKYTNCVVTRWYRPPELLLGARQYGGEVDIWGIGCVLGEMFMRKPILPGITDMDQLEKIWALCGTPNQHTWPNYDDLPGCEGVKRFNTTYSRRIKQAYDSIGVETCDLLDKLLTCNPRDRITATDALEHDYFWTDPLPADPKTLPSYEASHEFDKRGRRNGPPDGQYRPQQAQPYFGRPPPPRETFHNGPPRGQMHPPYPQPPPHAHPHYGPKPPYAYPPNGLPYPPGAPPFRQGERPGDRPSHLPPRPPGPPGRGGGQHNRDQRRGIRGGGGGQRHGGGGGGGGLNYG